jgi:ribonuclease HI
MSAKLDPSLVQALPKALKISGSVVTLPYLLEVMAEDPGELEDYLQRFPDISLKNFQQTLRCCASLLRQLEADAGLREPWDTSTHEPARPKSSSTGASASKKASSQYDTRCFVRTETRGQVQRATLHTDGASKGNPGQAGIGFLITSETGEILAQHSEAIGLATNNIAEYRALVEGLKIARQLEIPNLEVVGDSELVIKQMTGVYAIKHPDIRALALEAHRLGKSFSSIKYRHIPRAQNAHADALSTACISRSPKTKDERNGSPTGESDGES